MNKVKKAIIPAAGLGTRFLPFTKAVPKEMLPVVDVPAIELIVREIVESGIKEVLIITSGTKKSIEDHFDRAKELETALLKHKKIEMYNIVRETSELAEMYYVRQKEQNGLADAVYYGKSFTQNEPFALLLGDDVVHNPKKPATAQLCEVFEKTGKCILGVQKVAESELSKYGVLKCTSAGDRLYNVYSVTEKPKDHPPSDLAILGRYIFTAEIYKAIEETKPREAAGEIYLTDAFDYIIKSSGLLGFDFEGIRYDLGDKMGYLKATVEYGLRDSKLGGGFKKYLEELLQK